jgi:hypothetical protein
VRAARLRKLHLAKEGTESRAAAKTGWPDLDWVLSFGRHLGALYTPPRQQSADLDELVRSVSVRIAAKG